MELTKSLLKLKKSGKKIFLMTNFHVEFMNLVMKATLGDDYLDFFDLCIANAKKPLFFSGENSFYDLDLQAKDFRGEKYDSINKINENLPK